MRETEAAAKEKGHRETAEAARGFTDYLARQLDPAVPKGEKSLEALARRYEADAAAGADVPTTSLKTLQNWSGWHSWQDRVDAEVRKHNETVLKRMQSDLAGERYRAARRLLKALGSIEGQIEKGVAVDTKDLAGLQKQLFQVLGAPLADKVDVDLSGEIAIRQLPPGVVDLRALLADEAQREKVADLAVDPDAEGAGEDLPGGVGEGVEPRPLEDGPAPGPPEP